MSAPTSKRRRSPTAAVHLELPSGSVEDTQAFGEQVGRLLQAGDVVALYGPVGSGKTTFLQGLARGLGRDPGTIKSPTFVLMREYPGPAPLVHIDGYRLEGPTAVAWLDVDLMFSPRKITVIEWAERFEGLLPDARLEIWLSHVSANRRRLRFVSSGTRAAEVIARLQPATPQPGPASDDETPRD